MMSLEIHIQRIFNNSIKQNQQLGSDSVLKQSKAVSSVHSPASSIQSPVSSVQHLRPGSRNFGRLTVIVKSFNMSVSQFSF